MTITDKQAVGNFLMACKKSFKEVVYYDSANTNITMADAHVFLRPTASERTEEIERTMENKVEANLATKKIETKCYRCGKHRHLSSACTSSKWLCSKNMTDEHESETCPERSRGLLRGRFLIVAEFLDFVHRFAHIGEVNKDEVDSAVEIEGSTFKE